MQPARPLPAPDASPLLRVLVDAARDVAQRKAAERSAAASGRVHGSQGQSRAILRVVDGGER